MNKLLINNKKYLIFFGVHYTPFPQLQQHQDTL